MLQSLSYELCHISRKLHHLHDSQTLHIKNKGNKCVLGQMHCPESVWLQVQKFDGIETSSGIALTSHGLLIISSNFLCAADAKKIDS